MFKFNFNNEEKHSEFKVCDGQNEIHWYESKKVEIPSGVFELLNTVSRDQIIKLDYNCGITIFRLPAEEVMSMLKKKSENFHENFLDALTADRQHSDLLPGKYEGGLKMWECTKDLVNYFIKYLGETADKLNEKIVLDLGCGPGILGIMCLMKGAFVTFQDYNQEVLEVMTIPNIFLNCDDSVKNKIKLYSGDWSSFLHLITDGNEKQSSNIIKYDFILTSETIYNPENYKKIIKIIKRLLKAEGTAFVAAKTHYFGVGGNLKEFETLLLEEGLHCRTCWKNMEAWFDRNTVEQQSRSAAEYNKRLPRYDQPDRLIADIRKHRITSINGNGKIQNPRRAAVHTAAKK